MFPDCFVYGPARAPADGLRIFPGPVSRRSVLPAGTPVLLGQMTARLGARPWIGTECRMVAWLPGRDGRKLTAGSVLLGPDGEVLAAARTLWVTAARTVGGSG